MRLLKKLNIHGKILLIITFTILILGTISIIEYNSLITTDKVKKYNNILYKVKTSLYKFQYGITETAILSYQTKDINNLTSLVSISEKFDNLSKKLNDNIKYLKSIIVTKNASPEIKSLLFDLKDSLYTYEKNLNNIQIEYKQIVKFKKRLLTPHNIEENYIRYLQEEDLFSQIDINNKSQIQDIVKQIENKYKKNIANNLYGLQYNVNRTNQSIKNLQIRIHKLLNNNDIYLHNVLVRNKIINILIFFFSIILIFTITILISNQITSQVKEIEDTLSRLSFGELPDYKALDEENELGLMSLSLERLIEALKETTRFAEELSKGNFDYNFSPLSDKDEFRNLLLDLRDSLKRAKEEEEKRKIEDYQRRRISEGLAKFTDILRGQHKNLKKLAEEIITELVRYLNANQGAFFILNDKDPNNIYLELYAAYAWNRKKYLEKRVALGEGLIGAVAVEKFTIYMTDVPEDYIEIKSGTGEADPRAILIVPLMVQETVLGVIELATFEEFKDYEIELIEKISESIASTLQNIKINERTEELLQISQRQAEEMKKQEEVMKKTIEDLKKSQEETYKKEKELNNIIDELNKANEQIKIKDQELKNELERLKNEYEKKINLINKILKSYEEIIEKMNFPVIMFNKTGNIEFANTAFLEITNYDFETLTKLKITDLIEGTINEDSKNIIEDLENDLNTNNPKYKHLLIKSADGKSLKFQIDILKIDADDESKYVLIFNDTERAYKKERELMKELEEQYAKELDLVLRIEALEKILKEKNIEMPEADFEHNLIDWSEKFKMGIEVIDKQHEKWIYFINKLYNALKNKSANDTLNNIFKDLIEYTKYHFNFEEKYMAEFGYQHTNEHIKEHEYFVSELNKLYTEYINGKYNTPYKLLLYLKYWVENHVLVTDRGYKDIFKEKGLK